MCNVTSKHLKARLNKSETKSITVGLVEFKENHDSMTTNDSTNSRPGDLLLTTRVTMAQKLNVAYITTFV